MNKQVYNTDHCSIKKKKEILKEAYSICSSWWTDVLDCRISMYRKPIDIEFEEAMCYFRDDVYFTVIHRNSKRMIDEPDYLEVGFSTVDSGPTHFMWIIVPSNKMNDILELI